MTPTPGARAPDLLELADILAAKAASARRQAEQQALLGPPRRNRMEWAESIARLDGIATGLDRASQLLRDQLDSLPLLPASKAHRNRFRTSQP